MCHAALAHQDWRLTHVCSSVMFHYVQHLIEMEDESGHHEGCHIFGTITTKRVAGRLHLSVHQQMVFQLLPQVHAKKRTAQGGL